MTLLRHEHLICFQVSLSISRLYLPLTKFETLKLSFPNFVLLLYVFEKRKKVIF